MPEEGSQAQSPTCSPTGSHQWVTFLDPETFEEDQAAGQPSTNIDLGPLLKLGPDIKHFLQEQVTMQKEGNGRNLSQDPPVEDYKKWIEWRGCRVHTPDWWQELVGILGIDNFQELAWKVRASFEIPQAKTAAHSIDNDYSELPVPKCICQEEFLPLPNLMFPSWDFREGQSEKTLAYA